MQAIEVGQVWETRCKSGPWVATVTIDEIDGDRQQPVIGTVNLASGESRSRRRFRRDGGFHHFSSDGPSDWDLIRLVPPEKTLTEQTIGTFARIVRNGGKVPYGYTLQLNAKENRERDGWVDRRPVEVNFNDLVQLNVRLRQIDLPKPDPIPQPPRFSVSTDPIGVLDSQQPGMIRRFMQLSNATTACEECNKDHNLATTITWTPIAPEMVPLELADVPPGSFFKREGDSWLAPSDVCRTGVHFYGLDMPFEKLMEEGWQILRPGQTEWQKCEKVKP